MSTSEAMLPPANVLLPDVCGLKSWRPVFDDVRVYSLPGGHKSLNISLAGETVFVRTLTAEQAAHLAKLLTE